MDRTKITVDRTKVAVDRTKIAVDRTKKAVDRTKIAVDQKKNVVGRKKLLCPISFTMQISIEQYKIDDVFSKFDRTNNFQEVIGDK